MSHAPGPWQIDGQAIKSIDHGRRYTVATVMNNSFTPEANAANARVIAAAPDLLNACMRALLLLSDPEADENEADRVTLVLVDALRLAGSLDSKLELT